MDFANHETASLFRGKRLYRIVSVILMVYLCLGFLNASLSFLWDGPESSGISEILINFEGGFVRRGLMGELLYLVAGLLHCSPVWLIYPICIVAYVGCVYVFKRYFDLRGWNWWIIASPFLCGTFACFIRKDYLLILWFAVLLIFLHRQRFAAWGCIWTIFGIVLGLFIHEAFLFWGTPILLLLIVRCGKISKASKVVSVLIPLLIFVLLSYYKGDVSVQNSINRSWESFFGVGYQGSSIGFIGEQLQTIVKIHLTHNFGRRGNILPGIVMRPLLYMCFYYFAINAIFYFTSGRVKSIQEQTHLASLLLYSTCCMLPLFIFLSCDYGRLYQYLTSTSFLAFVILPQSVISQMFPDKVLRWVEYLNRAICHFIKPSFGLCLVLLFFCAESQSDYSLPKALSSNIFGELILFPFRIFSHHLL